MICRSVKFARGRPILGPGGTKNFRWVGTGQKNILMDRAGYQNCFVGPYPLVPIVTMVSTHFTN